MGKPWKDKAATYLIQTAIRIFNLVYSILRYFGIDILPLTFENVIRPLTPEQKEEASRKDFAVPLELYLQGFNRDPQTKGFQRFVALVKARDFAMRRAAVNNEIKRNPDILKTPVEKPLVIIGLPRTGTTLLQRMWKCDPQFLSTMVWEMMSPPVPPGRPDNWHDSDRYKAANNTYKMRDLLGLSDLCDKHHIGPDMEEECLVILNCYFLDMVDPLLVKGMEEWRYFLYNCSQEYKTSAYEFYKNFLKCMFYKNLDGGKLLSLKAPLHTLYLDTYREVFPEARFVFTYRNFKDITPSLCSLLYEIGEQNGYSGDKKEFGKRILEFYKNASERIVKFLKTIPKESIYVLGYSEIMKDPVEAVKKIYSHFGLNLTLEAQDAMKSHMQRNKKDKFGKHEYNIADYGITEEDIKETFAALLEYFENGSEKML